MYALVKRGHIAEKFSVDVPGYKHASSLVMIAAMVCNVDCTIQNIPNILDTKVMLNIMEKRGHKILYQNNTLEIKKSRGDIIVLDKEEANLIHNTMYMLPAFCPLQKEMFLPTTGGCRIGEGKNSERPIEHIIDIMKKSGAECKVYNDGIYMSYKKNISNINVDISEYSTDRNVPRGPCVSGATKAAIFVSMSSQGMCTIKNPYLKGDVISLLEFLKLAGFFVEMKNDTLYISRAFRKVSKINYEIISDPTVIITYICLSVYLGIPLVLDNISEKTISRELKNDIDFLHQIGVDIVCESDKVFVSCKNSIHKGVLDICCGNILSDHQPFYALLMSKGNEGGKITDSVWTNRFSYAIELNKILNSFRIEGSTLHITPGENKEGEYALYGADLRATAVLLIATAARDDISIVYGLEHLERGYEDFLEKLKLIGVDIQIKE